VTALRIVSVAGSGRISAALSPTDAQLIAAHEAAAGGDAILVPSDPALLASLPRHAETIVTVLDIGRTARDLERAGIARYGLRRARSLGPLTMARLLPTGLALGPLLSRSGIAGLGLVLVAAELQHAADLGIGAAALHWQLSDFLIANGQSPWLSRYIALARRCGLRTGLCANDMGRALRLAGGLRGLDFIVAPLSAAGFGMTPDRSTCETLIRDRALDLIPHLGPLESLDPDDRAYAESLGLTRFVVDI